jgi:hypothetical protein
MNIKERYSNIIANNSLVEFPKHIDRKRILKRAWTWFEDNGAERISIFADALKASWKAELDMIKSGGAIYHPYIMSSNYKIN